MSPPPDVDGVPPWSSRVPRILAWAATVVLVTGLLAAGVRAGSNGDDDGRTADTGDEPAMSTTTTEGTSTTTAESSTTSTPTTAGDAAAPTTVEPSDPTTTPTAPPASPPPARPAQYEYAWPAAYGGPVWITVTAPDDRPRTITIQWGPYQRVIAHAASDPRAYVFNKEVDRGDPVPVTITVDPRAEVDFGNGHPPRGAIDVNDGWTEVAE